MPFDAASPRPAAAARRRSKTDMTLGVFSHDGEWKVYSANDRPIHYDTHKGAMAAAEEHARDAARAGRRVELFVQEEDGTLRQATIDLIEPSSSAAALFDRQRP